MKRGAKEANLGAIRGSQATSEGNSIDLDGQVVCSLSFSCKWDSKKDSKISPWWILGLAGESVQVFWRHYFMREENSSTIATG